MATNETTVTTINTKKTETILPSSILKGMHVPTLKFNDNAEDKPQSSPLTAYFALMNADV